MPKRQTNSRKAAKKEPQPQFVVFHPQEMLILCIVSLLDVVMTNLLLTRGDFSFTESNPFARYFLDRWGLTGMAYFKLGMTVFVCVITQMIARKNAPLARRVFGTATVIVVGVVIYSVWLHFQHLPVIEVLEANDVVPCFFVFV